MTRLDGRAKRPQLDVGVSEWLRLGEHERVERLLDDLRALGVRRLRIGFSWADYHAPGGAEWYAWLLPRLSAQVEILPCFHYTPPSLGIVPKSSSPPRNPKDYADFLDTIVTRHGDHFEWVELWNEPNNLIDWDWRLDPDWQLFSTMIGMAAYWMRRRGKKTVFAGLSPADPHLLRKFAERGLLANFDAVGLHGFPGTWDFEPEGWVKTIAQTRAVLGNLELSPQIWITEAGYSTWRQDEMVQIEMFLDALSAPAERLYWYSLHDLDPRIATQNGFHVDERHYHFGLKRHDGPPKLLYRFWAEGGLPLIRKVAALGNGARVLSGEPRPTATATPAAAAAERDQRPALITGGAGFIGTNLAHRLASMGRTVILYDNLTRPGVERNLEWLRRTHGDRVQARVADMRDSQALEEAVRAAGQVFHLAAQVAVTTSLVKPGDDFAINGLGTVHLLEAIRACPNPPSMVFTSTNKVYGCLPDVALRIRENRYEPCDPALAASGIDESRSLDFRSPYGCSKGTADQYVLDYARSYGLPTAVFRMSCIYGPHQLGTEDQGWVAHFLIRAAAGAPITLFGDGRQVRDVLFVEDLVEAFLLAQEHMPALAGQAFNIGGGPVNTTSLLELLDLIADLHGAPPAVRFADWRTGDQRYYVSDHRRFTTATNWRPKTSVSEGVERLYDWLCGARSPNNPLPIVEISS